MHFKWNYEPPTPDEKKAADELAEKIGMSPILASLLIRRGITTESAAKRYFRPQLADLINPFLMKDMDIAVDRLNDAMGRKERILVYGDYDVDGCTAVALVYKFLQQFYSNIDYYIPDRYDEGYGISKKGHAALSLGGGRWVDVSFDYSGQNGAMLHTGGIPGNYVCGKIPGVDYSDQPVPEPGDAEDFRNYLMEHAPETIMTLYEKWRKQNG